MLSRGSDPLLWNSNISFPLERLYELIRSGMWSDLRSEDMWNSLYPDVAYQLWTTDPTSDDNVSFTLQNIRMTCAWCNVDTTLDLNEFQMLYSKSGTCQCSACDHYFNKEGLSAQILKNDLKQFSLSKAEWCLSCIGISNIQGRKRRRR